MNNKKEWEAEKIINKRYATLAAAVFEQAVIDASDKQAPVDIFLDAIVWLRVYGLNYLNELLGVNVGRVQYNELLQDLLDGNCQMLGHKRSSLSQLEEVKNGR